MKFGMSVPPFAVFADPLALAELAKQAEDAGWDGFFIWDHVMFDPTFHPIADPWVGLTAVALPNIAYTSGDDGHAVGAAASVEGGAGGCFT